MYQATDSRQRRRQRQKGSPSVPGNKKDEGRECASCRCPSKEHFCRNAKFLLIRFLIENS